MQPTLESVLKELPAYLGNFIQMLTQPAQLVHTHLQASDDNARLEKSIAFLLLSFSISLALAVVFPEVTNPVSLVGGTNGVASHAFAAIRLLFELLGLSALAYLAAKVAGVQSGFSRFFGLMCAATGVMLVVQVFAASLTNISMADPVTAKSWIQLEKGMSSLQPLIEQNILCATNAKTGEVTLDPSLGAQFQSRLETLQTVYLQATDRPLFKLATALQWLAMLVLLVWSGRLWVLYLRGHALGRGQSLLATLLLLVFTGTGSLIYMLVNTGNTMMDLYRHCS